MNIEFFLWVSSGVLIQIAIIITIIVVVNDSPKFGKFFLYRYLKGGNWYKIEVTPIAAAEQFGVGQFSYWCKDYVSASRESIVKTETFSKIIIKHCLMLLIFFAVTTAELIFLGRDYPVFKAGLISMPYLFILSCEWDELSNKG